MLIIDQEKPRNALTRPKELDSLDSNIYKSPYPLPRVLLPWVPIPRDPLLRNPAEREPVEKEPVGREAEEAEGNHNAIGFFSKTTFDKRWL